MANGKWLPDFIERLKASAWHQLYLPLLPFTHARSESINADSLKLQLLTARKKGWWPATADSSPQAVYLTTVKHTALVGIEPTTIRSWVRRATSCATETTIYSISLYSIERYLTSGRCRWRWSYNKLSSRGRRSVSVWVRNRGRCAG